MADAFLSLSTAEQRDILETVAARTGRPAVILINRAIHAPPFDLYADVCDSYDLAIHERESDVERSRQVYDSLKIEPGTKILDIGCGTGSLVDFRFRDIDPGAATSASIPVEGCRASSETSILNSAAV